MPDDDKEDLDALRARMDREHAEREPSEPEQLLDADAHIAQLGPEQRRVYEPLLRQKMRQATADTPLESKPWPEPPATEAFHGLAGDVVRAIAPHTEADPMALLLHVLVGYGSMIGRGAYYQVEDTRHHANEFGILVGRTSKGRKGTSERRIRHVLEAVDPAWDQDHVVSGLSSGEGLIWQVRDPIYRMERDRRTRTVEEVLVDLGVSDKRLLVIEPEFASTLRVMARQGNTLSAIVRRAWDEGNLRALTKNSPAKATGAHISIIGHITDDELRAELDRTDAANGFGNRFLYLCVQRSHVLPFGGAAADTTNLRQRVTDAAHFGQATSEMHMDDKARLAWESVYTELSAGHDGLFGAVTARAEAHTIRLALLYALLDLAMAIRVEHLLAALAVWNYAEESARYVFGDATGDHIADEILEALRKTPDGMTRTDISNLFGRNETSGRIAKALLLLLTRGKARRQSEPTGTRGRDSERWFAA